MHNSLDLRTKNNVKPKIPTQTELRANLMEQPHINLLYLDSISESCFEDNEDSYFQTSTLIQRISEALRDTKIKFLIIGPTSKQEVNLQWDPDLMTGIYSIMVKDPQIFIETKNALVKYKQREPHKIISIRSSFPQGFTLSTDPYVIPSQLENSFINSQQVAMSTRQEGSSNTPSHASESLLASRNRASQSLRQACGILNAAQDARANRIFYRNVVLGSVGMLLVSGGLFGLIGALTFSGGLIAFLSALSLTTKATTAVAVVGSCVAVSFFLMKKVRNDAITANTALEYSRYTP